MAWPKLTKNANFGPNLVVLGQKILISTGKIKSFVTHITENPPRHLVHIGFWLGIGLVYGTQSSQLRRWEGLFYHFSLNKSLMGLTQSCGKNSDWFVTITQSCGKALIGWSQIRKSGDRIFDLSELCHRFE